MVEEFSHSVPPSSPPHLQHVSSPSASATHPQTSQLPFLLPTGISSGAFSADPRTVSASASQNAPTTTPLSMKNTYKKHHPHHQSPRIHQATSTRPLPPTKRKNHHTGSAWPKTVTSPPMKSYFWKKLGKHWPD